MKGPLPGVSALPLPVSEIPVDAPLPEFPVGDIPLPTFGEQPTIGFPEPSLPTPDLPIDGLPAVDSPTLPAGVSDLPIPGLPIPELDNISQSLPESPINAEGTQAHDHPIQAEEPTEEPSLLHADYPPTEEDTSQAEVFPKISIPVEDISESGTEATTPPSFEAQLPTEADTLATSNAVAAASITPSSPFEPQQTRISDELLQLAVTNAPNPEITPSGFETSFIHPTEAPDTGDISPKTTGATEANNAPVSEVLADDLPATDARDNPQAPVVTLAPTALAARENRRRRSL